MAQIWCFQCERYLDEDESQITHLDLHWKVQDVFFDLHLLSVKPQVQLMLARYHHRHDVPMGYAVRLGKYV